MIWCNLPNATAHASVRHCHIRFGSPVSKNVSVSVPFQKKSSRGFRIRGHPASSTQPPPSIQAGTSPSSSHPQPLPLCCGVRPSVLSGDVLRGPSLACPVQGSSDGSLNTTL